MDDLRVGKFSVGDAVQIIEGNFKNLKGDVSMVYDRKQVVQVSVVLRSKLVLMDFPSTYLKKV
jgi:transcription antitermination factor NusG